MTERSMGVTRACGLVGISRSLFAYESTRNNGVRLQFSAGSLNAWPIGGAMRA
jgi:hypothetical protein